MNNKISVFIELNGKIETIPILTLNDPDKQQRWIKAKTDFTSSTVFRFVFEGEIASEANPKYASIAIDDISYSKNCFRKESPPPSSSPATTTTTSTTQTTQTNPTNPTASTPTPKPYHPKKGKDLFQKKEMAQIFLADSAALLGVIIPLLLLAAGIAGYYFYKKYQTKNQPEDMIALSMKSIEKKLEDESPQEESKVE